MHDFRSLLCLAFIVATRTGACGEAATAGPTWTDHGPTFSAGTLGNAGQNLYLNRRGELESIRRYDLDGNGYLDLLFNSTHDNFYGVPATLVRAAAGTTQLSFSSLEVAGSNRVIPADLNRDGFTDLVFLPNRQNTQKERASVIIAWGAADGWSPARLTRQLPGNAMSSLAVGDLNGDGWPDLLTLNSEGWLHGQPEGKIVRVFWGGPEGFFLEKFQDLGIPDAIEVATGGFGAERRASAAVITATGSLHLLAYATEKKALEISRTLSLSAPAATVTAQPQCLLVQSAENSRSDSLWIGTDAPFLFHVDFSLPSDVVKTVAAVPATHLALGKLDDDAWPDLVLTQLQLTYPASSAAEKRATTVTVLWGRESGFDKERSSSIALPNASATAIGDLNADGHGDLLVAVFQGATSMQASSRIYFGDGRRQLVETGAAVATEGAQGVALASVSASGPPVAVFANSVQATLESAVPVRLYWGSARGFSPQSFVDIPNLSGYKASGADLNDDGYVDLVVLSGGEADEAIMARNPTVGANIYWGGPTGKYQGPGPTRFDPDRRQILPALRLGSVNTADLNGDGFLDLVLGSFESSQPGTDLLIYFGSAHGFSPDHRQVLAVPDRSIGCLIADFNRDGKLDIVVGGYLTNQVITYWGSNQGYSTERKSVLPYTTPIDLEAADLNNDGWLDLLVASYNDRIANHHDTGLSLFWGGPQGWHQSNSQWLPGMTPLGLAVADLDGDGFLDIVSPHYHGELSREHLPSYIYWGSAHGYAAPNRTSLTVNSASDVVIADFNRDGKFDLAFCAHSTDPGHLLDSPIFFNDGHRFRTPTVQYLPAVGPHYMWVQDIGNIYHRRYEETFISRALAWDQRTGQGQITLDAATPFGSHVDVQVRSAVNEAALVFAPWRNVSNNSFNLPQTDRALQYRLALISANGDAYPIVRKVVVQLK